MSGYTEKDRKAKEKEQARVLMYQQARAAARAKVEACAADGGHVYDAHGVCVGCGDENLLMRRKHD